jgi:deoxyxylulose-5-phosphate synthase
VLAAVEEFDVTVLYATTVYPLDGKMLREHAAPSPDVVLVEPMYEGTTTAQVTRAFEDRAVRLLSVGVPRDVVEGYGTVAELDVAVGLGEEALARRIGGFLRTREGTPMSGWLGGG